MQGHYCRWSLVGNATVLTALIITGVCLDNPIIKPHMGDCHSILCEGSGLVRANGRGRSQGLDSFQILHQTVLTGHALSCQGQTHLGRAENELSKTSEVDSGLSSQFCTTNETLTPVTKSSDYDKLKEFFYLAIMIICNHTPPNLTKHIKNQCCIENLQLQ